MPPSESSDDAAGADLRDRVLDPGEQRARGRSSPATTVALAGLRARRRRTPSAPSASQRGDVPAEAEHVAADVVGRLLEGDEDARLAGLTDARGQELGGEDRLGAAGGARDQRRPPRGQAAVGDQVEALDLGPELGRPEACSIALTARPSQPAGRRRQPRGRRSSPSSTRSRVRQVADDPPDRRRQLLDHRRRRQDLLVLGQLRPFQHVDDDQLVTPDSSSSQIRRRLAMARCERGVCPVT